MFLLSGQKKIDFSDPRIRTNKIHENPNMHMHFILYRVTSTFTNNKLHNSFTLVISIRVKLRKYTYTYFVEPILVDFEDLCLALEPLHQRYWLATNF